MSFEAQYAGACGCCGDYFNRGAEVGFTSGGIVLVEHLREQKPQPVCPKCFMELPLTGVCDSCD